MRSINIKFPLENDPEKNNLFKLNNVTKEALSSNLLLLLLTEKGERYYYPTYGTNLKKFIFEQKDGILLNEIEQDIKESINTFIPQLSIKRINFFSQGNDDDGDPVGENELKIVIDFSFDEGVFSEDGRVELTF